MSHTCHAIGCEKVVAPSLFMCGAHWTRLPYVLRQAIWKHYMPGQEIRKDPSPEYVEAANKARHWLHMSEEVDGQLCVVCIEKEGKHAVTD